MTLTRKAVVIGLIGLVLLAANALVVANWLAETGVVSFARMVMAEYLTGTAITIILALLILLVGPKRPFRWAELTKSCPVCDHKLSMGDAYCSSCGSKV